MKKLFLLFVAIIILLSGSQAWCAPYLVCTSDTTATHYKITGDAYWTSSVTAQADGSLRSDVSGIAKGVHNINVAACRADAVWQEVCSATVPFVFTRPAGPNLPTGIKLSQ